MRKTFHYKSHTQTLNKTLINYFSEKDEMRNLINKENYFLPIFNHSCNLMKDIEIEKKDQGLDLMENLIKLEE